MDELSSLLANDHVLADHTIRDRLFFVLTVAKNEDFLLKVLSQVLFLFLYLFILFSFRFFFFYGLCIFRLVWIEQQKLRRGDSCCTGGRSLRSPLSRTRTSFVKYISPSSMVLSICSLFYLIICPPFLFPSPFAQASSSSVLGKNTKLDMVKASEFPFNKSYSGDAAYGGKTVSVDFSANVFAGNLPLFSYYYVLLPIHLFLFLNNLMVM